MADLDFLKFVESKAGNTIFSVEFVKRTTGERRLMVCRLYVKRDQTGTGLAFDPISKGLLPVYDMQKRQYRMIAMEGVLWIKVRGEVHRFREVG